MERKPLKLYFDDDIGCDLIPAFEELEREDGITKEFKTARRFKSVEGKFLHKNRDVENTARIYPHPFAPERLRSYKKAK